MTQHSIKDGHYLPFMIHGRFFQTRGILRIDAQFLTLEFQHFLYLFPSIHSGINTLYLPFLSFHKAELMHSFIRFRLLLQSNSLYPFRCIPGANSGQAQFIIPHYARDQALDFVRCLQLRLSEHHLNDKVEDRAQRIFALDEKHMPHSTLKLFSRASL